ncbi:MAG TPA: SRPBCC family protein [Armatimonadota bacterium]|jgi:ribosome-associated toxin RatA of RatAB toxin-antitoxin module|nr:hypothetical protein [Armatimonadota bacterium]HOJ20484.1 SRPBCC family protein [Armatimonadota bacterium]HOM81741.1 SRPBCC family protein [Armatimonadota bacterium]HOQ29791.1 SRPBCC family protein [Armatimonadota bacterium]HPO74540.1 SRPBCC family protein [Armatimonadota bacterium]
MPHFETSIVVNAPVAEVFALARDIERYPEFMPDVKSIRVTERSGKSQVSEWVALVSQFRIEMKWSEEDIWDEETYTCTWRQIKGDFQQYDGRWTFEPAPEGGTRMTMQVDYRYEVPLIGPMLKALVHKLMVQNANDILAALKKQAEGG